MAGIDDNNSSKWRWFLNEIEFVAQYGAGTTKETATEFLLDEIAAGRIPYQHRQIEGWQIPLEHFFLRHRSIRHEVAVDNAVIRTGPVMILAANARGEMEHILDLTQPRRPVYTRMTLVLLDHDAVVHRLQAVGTVPQPRMIFISEVPAPLSAPSAQEASTPEPEPPLPPPSSPCLPVAQELPAPATQPQSMPGETQVEGAAAESKWNPDTEWSVARALQELGIRGRQQEAIAAKVPELSRLRRRYRDKSIVEILDDIRPADLDRAVGSTSPDSCGRFLRAWKAYRTK